MASTLTNLIYHIVFSTKMREPMITEKIRDELYWYIGGIIKEEGGVLLQIGGMPDHVHLVVKLKPVHTLSLIMRMIKGSSSKMNNIFGLEVKTPSFQDGLIWENIPDRWLKPPAI
jgi:putative transposase